jgi:hypothetical protein
MGSDADINRIVRRRRVFYVPGYDPMPPRRYRELYRREGPEQARISGYGLRSRRPAEPTGWRVEAVIDGLRVETEIEVLVWSDLVRDSMSKSIPAVYRDLVRTVWIYLRSGAFARLIRLRKGPVIAGLYPVVLLIVQAAIAAGLGGLTLALAASVLPGAVALVAGLVVAGLVLRGFRAQDGRFYAYYLMQDYAFAALDNGAAPPGLPERLDAFAARIREAMQDEVDEVLVVGHSSGAQHAVSALARVLEGLPERRVRRLACSRWASPSRWCRSCRTPMRLRADLRAVSQAGTLTWVDVSAPGDGCSFALCDPVAVSGVAGPTRGGGRWSCRRRSAGPCRPGNGGRCGGAFSGCISSICAPSTGQATTITSRSPPGPARWRRDLPDARRRGRASRTPCPVTGRWSRDPAQAKGAAGKSVAVALCAAVPAGSAVGAARPALLRVDGRVSHAVLPVVSHQPA